MTATQVRMTDMLRRATIEDADTLSSLGARTFAETFGHLYPTEDLETFLAYAYGLERTRGDLAHPEKAGWILEDEDGEAIGYALAGSCDLPHDEARPEDGEVKRIYVLKSHQGGGRGSRLLTTALDWLGSRRIWIGVWSENFGAQKLYGRLGFAKVGEYEFPVGETRDLEFILRRDPPT